MAKAFRRLDEIMIVIYYSHDFCHPLTSLMNWCCKGQSVISPQHSAMEHGRITGVALNVLTGCVSSTSPVLSLTWDN